MIWIAKKQRRLSVTQQIMVEVKESLNRYQHDLTRQQYTRNMKYFVQYCREKHNCRILDECRAHIDEYINTLIDNGMSACTIHTYAAAISATLRIPLNTIKKPKRIISEFTRGRKEIQYLHSSQDLENPAYKRLIDFAKKVGIRREEYAKLKKSSWTIDPSTGKHAIFVARGKHGKEQYQLVRDEDVPWFENFFAEVPDDRYIFSKAEMNNHLNLHRFRADNAKRWYAELEQKLKDDPSYADIMIEQIKARYVHSRDPRTGKPKHFDPKSVEGFYFLRKSLRQKQISENKPIKFNRLIVKYVSIFCLSHYRESVCIQNYLLA